MVVGAKRLLLHVCRLAGLFRLSRHLTRDKLRILGYHGFALDDECRWRPRLFVSIPTFRRRLAYLKRCGSSILSLDEAMARLESGRLPNLPTVITIDDGLAGVGLEAAPILRDAGIPATLYVTTYYVVYRAPVFRLVVSYLFWKTARRQIDLARLGIGLAGVVRLVDDKQIEQTAWDIVHYGEDHCDEDQRVEISRRLADALGLDYDEVVRSRKLSLLTEDEIRSLPASGISIQLHTHRHRFPYTFALLEQELADNREVLAPLVGGPLEHFCYPDGAWTESRWPWLANMGVVSAVTCVPGLCDSASPRLGLPRILDDESLSQVEFEAEVSGFATLVRAVRSRLRGGIPYCGSHPIPEESHLSAATPAAGESSLQPATRAT